MPWQIKGYKQSFSFTEESFQEVLQNITHQTALLCWRTKECVLLFTAQQNVQFWPFPSCHWVQPSDLLCDLQRSFGYLSDFPITSSCLVTLSLLELGLLDSSAGISDCLTLPVQINTSPCQMTAKQVGWFIKTFTAKMEPRNFFLWSNCADSQVYTSLGSKFLP